MCRFYSMFTQPITLVSSLPNIVLYCVVNLACGMVSQMMCFLKLTLN